MQIAHRDSLIDLRRDNSIDRSYPTDTAGGDFSVSSFHSTTSPSCRELCFIDAGGWGGVGGGGGGDEGELGPLRGNE